MTLDNISVPLALAAGAASFLSPCVLPLDPWRGVRRPGTRGPISEPADASPPGGLR